MFTWTTCEKWILDWMLLSIELRSKLSYFIFITKFISVMYWILVRFRSADLYTRWVVHFLVVRENDGKLSVSFIYLEMNLTRNITQFSFVLWVPTIKFLANCALQTNGRYFISHLYLKLTTRIKQVKDVINILIFTREYIGFIEGDEDLVLQKNWMCIF